jgi:hypothetical protein
MEIISSTTHQVLLLRYDEIPRTKMLTQKRALSELRSKFQFQAADIDENLNIIAQMGLYQDENGEYPIRRLVIEERRILIDVEGPSKIADKIISELRLFITAYSNRIDTDFLKPIITAHESEIVAKLIFPFEKLLAPEFNKFILEDAVAAMNSNKAVAKANPSLLTFLISYQSLDESLEDFKVSISRKEFTIGPRPGFPVSDKIYYSKAPVDTDKHIELLARLEEVFK